MVTEPPVVRNEVTVVGEFLGSPRALGDAIFGIGSATLVVSIVASGVVIVVAVSSTISVTTGSETDSSVFCGASGEGGKLMGRLSDLDPSTASGTYNVHGA